VGWQLIRGFNFLFRLLAKSGLGGREKDAREDTGDQNKTNGEQQKN
jgi:hypothetical protein